jgi:adenylylsulfate kinase-like enzyme
MVVRPERRSRTIYNRETIVWLSGPTGAGKTSIAHLLGASGHSVVAEYAPEGLFQTFACHPSEGL